MRTLIAYTFAICSFAISVTDLQGAEFDRAVKPLLAKFCFECHSGETPNGDVDFEAIQTADDVVKQFNDLERAIEHLKAKTMPPKDEAQPTPAEVAAFDDWYADYVANIQSRPATLKPRRLSVNEYRNTMRSLFGFDLLVVVIEAEQTRSERSLVVKLMPTDPPGRSGFKNDTHRNPLSQNAWDQYSYLAETALEQLFSSSRLKQLEKLVGPISGDTLSTEQADTLLQEFRERTRRRPSNGDTDSVAKSRFSKYEGDELVDVLKLELKSLLMSPTFLYRGLLATSGSSGRQPVDDFELAERLSYFLWADMPDERLQTLAADGSLSKAPTIASEIDRMLKSDKAASLSEIFATEWLTIDEIEHVTQNLPQMLALKTQPVDFMNYLFTDNRPLLELVDSETAFINPHTSRMYGADAKQMKRPPRTRGIEVAAYPNQQITLKQTQTRGGILTMPGILAMNQGPIQRGTWMLERILGEELPEPPANVGQVPGNTGNKKLSFRERFEQHRSNATCAVCHDKIDPLGFALQDYDRSGNAVKGAGYKSNRRDVKKGLADAKPASDIDTSGQLPTGETFDNIAGLKKILRTSQRRVVIRNIVERTLSYALCRQLMIYDRPTVESITDEMDSSNGTWRDLFIAIANSVPFREAVIVK